MAADIDPIALTKYAHGKFRTAGTHQSGNTYHLTLAGIHAHIIYHLPLRIQRMVNAPILNFQHHIPNMGLSLGESVGKFSAHHTLDDARLGNVVCFLIHCLNGGTVTDDSNLIRHIRDFVEFMGYDDGRHTLFLKLEQKIQKRLGIRLIQGCCGFV